MIFLIEPKAQIKIVEEKELVLLLSKEESYLVEVRNKTLHTQSGTIDLGTLLKKKPGNKIKTHLGKEFVIVKPNFGDLLNRKMKRLPQIVMPKDAALIIAFTGINNDSLVVDAGSGSGFLALFLANYVAKGKVITYERNKEFYKVVKKNVEISGLNNIEVKNKDITKGIDEKNVDLITLDMKNAEKVIKHAYKALKQGGWLAVYSPYIEQVIEVRKEIEKRNFTQITTVENVVREWQVEKFSRPKTIGIMHTGFITFARKVS
jgi:tRNA (adenine57-N1/adenine58-N1)-methyltransferase